MAMDKPGSTETDQRTTAPSFDADALRAKYQEEREKRLCDDANDQYVHIGG